MTKEDFIQKMLISAVQGKGEELTSDIIEDLYNEISDAADAIELVRIDGDGYSCFSGNNFSGLRSEIRSALEDIQAGGGFAIQINDKR